MRDMQLELRLGLSLAHGKELYLGKMKVMMRDLQSGLMIQ